MKELTKKVYTAMTVALAAGYGVESVAQAFSVSPTVVQVLSDKIVEESDFLQRINVLPVDDLKGEKVLGSATGLIGKRTDTDNNDRETTQVLGLASKDYELFETEFDVHLKYKTVDSWSKFKDFNERYARYVRKAIAHARIRTGFIGITAAVPETDPVTYPNGEDVNKGWLQHLREFNGGSQWLLEGGTSGELRMGAGGDYENLDAMVHDVLQMVSEVHRDSGDLVALVGRDLLAQEKAQLYKEQGQKPTEKERIENNAVTRTYGSLPAFTTPFFPSRGLLVTSWDNLSIYFQDTSWRRHVRDNPTRNRVEDFNSVNEGYIIEDEEKAAGVEFANVKVPDGVGGWA